MNHMLKKFPLFTIALLYIFSTKDKIVFFMQQFSLLIISLCIAVILCSFSVINGWNIQITNNILNQISPIIITPKLGDLNNKENVLMNYNLGFKDFTPNNHHIINIQKIRNQETLLNINDKKYNVSVYEDELQKDPLTINQALFTSLFIDKDKDNLAFQIFDPNSYNPMIGSGRFKQYKTYELNDNKEQSYVIKLSQDEYKKLFRTDNYNRFNIYLDDPELAASISQTLKSYDENIEVKYWKEFNTELFDALELQKRIFLLVYTIMFILLCAIIISTNIAFFKEKRKDWALFKILNTVPYSVEKVFAYKSLISFIISTTIGVALGVLFSVYSNEIINVISYFTGSRIDSKIMFGNDKLMYEFKIKDFILIFSFSFFIFFINFIILISVFRRENTANFLRTQ